MLGYLINHGPDHRYNLGYTLFIPLALFATVYRTHQHLLMAIATIWFSHIAFDRVLGMG